MSIVSRLLRAFETLSKIENDEKTRGGIRGEDYAEFVIDGEQEVAVRNPLLPHPTRSGYYLEIDFLIFTRGTLFAIEVKNYRGRVYYPEQTHREHVNRDGFVFRHQIAVDVGDGFDHRTMIQEKRDFKTGIVTHREIPNPLLKTQRYIEDLKRSLIKIDSRFRSIPIIAVVGFAERTDISAIADFDGGIMHISQLPAFFAKYGSPDYQKTSYQWLCQILYSRIRTWDRIQTTGTEWINGVLLESSLTFKETNGQTRSIRYSEIYTFNLRRKGLFSAYDELTITFMNGKKQIFHSKDGEIRLNHFGRTQIHRLRNINALIVGIANKQ